MRNFIILTFFIQIILACNVVQANPHLIADIITVSDDGNILKAKGKVEVYFEDKTLKASVITYNKLTDEITAVGPIILTNGDQTIIFADKAILDKEFTSAVFSNAKLVLSNSLEISSAKIVRAKGKFNNFYQTIASTCKVCKDGETRLWEIRAKKIVHDTKEKQIYFYNSQFRFFGLPIVYFPILRIPDPSVKRANGFLIPEINHSSKLGTEITMPYFVTLGSSADITLKPKISTNSNFSLEAEYQKLFEKSNLELDIIAINKSFASNEPEGYLFMKFDTKISSDKLFSAQFQRASSIDLISDHTTKNLNFTENFLNLNQQTTSLYSNTGFYQIVPQSASLNDLNTPDLTHDSNIIYVFYPKMLGGQGQFQIDATGYKRNSIINGTLGHDKIGTKVDILWKKNIIAKTGLVTNLGSITSANLSKYYNDANYTGFYTNLSQTSGVSFSYPILKQDGFTSTVIEPKIQLIYSVPSDFETPNEDSTLTELSVSNFSNLNRSNGMDRIENGLRLQTSLKSSYKNKNGFESKIFLGNVNRISGNNNFSTASGLNDLSSNFVGKFKVNILNKFNLNGGVIANNNLSILHNEFEINYNRSNKLSMYSKYFYKDKDENSSLNMVRSELNLGSNYQIGRNTKTNVNIIYDVTNGKIAKSEIGSLYKHECMAFNLFLARDFYSATSINPGLSVGLKFKLTGLNKSNNLNNSTKCNG